MELGGVHLTAAANSLIGISLLSENILVHILLLLVLKNK